MTADEERAAWDRVYHEIPDAEIRADARGYTRFLICVWLMILLAVFSIAYTVTSIGAEILR